MTNGEELQYWSEKACKSEDIKAMNMPKELEFKALEENLYG
jgi:hypothetical protein